METACSAQDRHPFGVRDLHRLDSSDIMPRQAYAQCRRAWLPRLRDYLRRRRVRLSANASLLFENVVTVRHQVQEVLYWETRNDAAAQARTAEELDTYRALLPRPSGLSATLLVDGGSRESGLAIGQALASNEPGIGLLIGDRRVPATLADADPDPAEPIKFLRFNLTLEERRVLLSGSPVSAWIAEDEQPEIRRLCPQTVAMLVDDLGGDLGSRALPLA